MRHLDQSLKESLSVLGEEDASEWFEVHREGLPVAFFFSDFFLSNHILKNGGLIPNALHISFM